MTIDGTDLLRQQQGKTPSPAATPQSVDSRSVSSQPIDMTGKGRQEPLPVSSDQSSIFSSDSKEQPVIETEPKVKPDEVQSADTPKANNEAQKVIHEVKKGDTLWDVAKKELIASGIEKPTNAQIMAAMNSIAQANGCKSVNECKNKFFNKIGSQLDVSVLHQKDDGDVISDSNRNVTADVSEQPIVDDKQTVVTNPKDSKSVPASELEILAQEIGIDGDIDTIVQELRMKETLTEQEKRFIELYDNRPKPANVSTEQSGEFDLVKAAKQVVQSGILDKKPEEQVNMLAKMYVKGNKDFESMTPEQKQEYLTNIANSIAEIASEGNKNWKNLSSAEKMEFSVRAMVLVGISKKENIKIEDILSMQPEQREAIIKKAESKIADMTIKILNAHINSEEFSKLTYKEKVEKYADTMLSLLDDNFKNLSAQQQKQIRDSKIAEYAKKLGINVPKDDKAKEIAYSHFLVTLEGLQEFCDKHPEVDIATAIDKYKTWSPAARNSITIKHLQNLENAGKINDEQKKILTYARCEDLCLNGLSFKDGKSVKTSDVLANINKILANPEKYNLTDEQRVILENRQHILRREILLNGKNCEYRPFLTNTDKFVIDGGEKNIQEVLIGRFDGISAKNIFSEVNMAEHQAFLADANDNELISYIQFLKEHHISDKDIRTLLSNRDLLSVEKYNSLIARAQNSDVLAKILGIGEQADFGEANVRIAKCLSCEEFSDVMKNENDFAEVGITLSNNYAATQSLYEGMWENGKSKEFVMNVTDNVGHSDRITESARSNVYKTAVTTAPDDATKLYMGQELSSRTDNAAALEGLAAASNSIQDTNTRNQYNTHVDNAVTKAAQSGKYSDEEVAQMKKDVQQARETGMTKAETAQAKENQQKVQTSAQKTQQQQKTEQKAQQQALVQKKQTVLEHAKTVIATVTAAKPKASGAASPTDTQAAKAVEQAQRALNQTLERLAKAQATADIERAKQELMQRIEQFQAEVRRSQEERELRLSEQEVLNAVVTDPEITEADEAQPTDKVPEDVSEAVDVAMGTEVTAEEGASATVVSHAAASGLSVEAVQELHEAYSSGGLTALYDKAATIVGAKAQERLLNYISHTSSSTLHSFADAHSGNKHVLMTLFQNSKDPYIMQLLIRNGYASEVLGSGAVTVKDFMAYASPETVASWLTDLQKTGATSTLKEAFANIGRISGSAADALPGSDAWLKAQRASMSGASATQNQDLAQTDPARTPTISSGTEFDKYDGLAVGSNRVRMGYPVDKKVDKRFFRMG